METLGSLDDIAALINKFYAGSRDIESMQSHSEINKILTELQQSQQGFQIADGLLQRPEQQVRFFGSTIFAAKLLPGSEFNVSKDEEQELLNRLLQWVATACDNEYDHATITKLSACLVSFFFITKGTWKNCMLHLLATLAHGRPQSVDPPSEWAAVKDVIASLSPNRLFALYSFMDIFVQGIGFKSSPVAALAFAQEIKANVPMIVKIIEHTCENVSDLDDDYMWYSAKAIQALAVWSKETLPDAEEVWVILRPTVSPFIGSILVGDIEAISDTMTDLMSDAKSFLQPQHHQEIKAILLSPTGNEWIEEVQGGNQNMEPWWFARFLLNYCTLQNDTFLEGDPDAPALYYRILKLTQCEGVAVLEDEIVPHVIEFWQNLCESLSMKQFASEGKLTSEYWLQWLDGLIPQMASAVIEKAKLPSMPQMKTWMNSERDRFNDMRRDISAVMGTLYELLGKPLVDHVLAYIWQATANRDWSAVESGLNAMDYLSEYTDTEEEEAWAVLALFGSRDANEPPLLSLLHTEEVSLLAVKRAITFIDTFARPICRQEEHLPSILNLLSRCLQPTSTLAPIAAKAISCLCHTAREKMTPILPNLLTLHETYTASELKHDPFVQARLTTALSSVIQASTVVTNLEDWKSGPAMAILNRLLDTFEENLKRSQQLLVHGEKEKAQEVNLATMQCLASMGRAFREPEDGVVDLDDKEPSQEPPSIWLQDLELVQNVQSRIWSLCTNALTKFGGADEVEQFCQILRAGYTEERPGPFVFPITATESFVTQCSLETPRIGMVLETVETLIKRNKSRSPVMLAFSQKCIAHVRGMIFPFFKGNPSEDPEIASLVIDYLRAFSPRYTDCLFADAKPDELRHCFDFIITCLGSSEIMPKRSAASFWVTLLKDKGRQSDCTDSLDRCIDEYSQSLAEVLARGIGGGASRSELDELSEPLRELAFRGRSFIMHFRHAVANVQVSGNRVSPSQKKIFVEQVFKLRGGAKTNNVVKEFWAACRGTFTM